MTHSTRSTGRVFLLSFYDEKRFFWMQEPNANKDAECAPSPVLFFPRLQYMRNHVQILCQFEAGDW